MSPFSVTNDYCDPRHAYPRAMTPATSHFVSTAAIARVGRPKRFIPPILAILLSLCFSANAGVVGFRTLSWNPVVNADYYVVSNSPCGICITSRLTHATVGLTMGTNTLCVKAVSQYGVESDWSTNLMLVNYSPVK